MLKWNMETKLSWKMRELRDPFIEHFLKTVQHYVQE